MKKLLFAVLALVMATHAQAAERRIALVIGNANYQTGALPTPANDAGLIAQTLQAAGFDVTGARDLDQDSLRQAFRDFLQKASSSGPDTVVYIYLSGYGLQLEGENYFVPVDARIPNAADVASESIRLSDYLKPLAALHLKASVVVLDLARANPFAKSGAPLAGGLSLIEPGSNMLIAFNAAPGTVAPNEAGPYSAYAEALASISREGGIPVDEVFTRVRLRVNETTKGAEVPWQSSKLAAPLYLFDRAPGAPAPAVSAEQTSSIRTKPIRDFDAHEAYLAALDRDTLRGYLDFVAAYPGDPMVPRVRAIIAARREAITWRRTCSLGTPRAYWSYLRRYPHGPHSYDARRRLRDLAAALEPPPSFTVIEYDVPPPPPDELIYIDRPVLVFDDPGFDFAPPPPVPVIFLPPPPVYFIDLPPPPPPVIAFVLPFPVYRPVPVWVVPPPYIAPPPRNVIYNNIHNTVVINNVTNMVTITNPQGQSRTVSPAVALTRASAAPGASPSSAKAGVAAAALAAGGAAAILAPSLPKAVVKKAALTPSPRPAPPAKPLAPGRVLHTHAVVPAAHAGAPGTPAAANKAPPRPGESHPAMLTPPAGAAAKPSSRQLEHSLPGARGGPPLPPHNTAATRVGTPTGARAQPDHRALSPGLKTATPRPTVSGKPSSPRSLSKREIPKSSRRASSPAPVAHGRPPAIGRTTSRSPTHAARPTMAPKQKLSSRPPRRYTPPPRVVHAPPPRQAMHSLPAPRVVHAPAPRVVHAPPPARLAPAPRRAPAVAARPAPRTCMNGRPCPKR